MSSFFENQKYALLLLTQSKFSQVIITNLKVIQDKNTVAYFSFTNLQLIFRLFPLTSAGKSNRKTSQSKNMQHCSYLGSTLKLFLQLNQFDLQTHISYVFCLFGRSKNLWFRKFYFFKPFLETVQSN